MLEALPAVATARVAALHPFTAADYWDAARRAAGGRVIVIVWQGNQHLSRFLVAGEPFRLCEGGGGGEPKAADDIDEVPWVPVSMVEATFETSLVPLGELLSSLSAARQLLVVGTPPPKPDHVVRAALADEWALAKIVRDHGYEPDTVPLSPLPLRLALWRVLQRCVAAWATEAGATFVSVPQQAISTDGCLREEYWYADASHANAAYGSLVWSAVLSAAGRREQLS